MIQKETELWDDLTRVNNELVNTQRELIRKNSEINRLNLELKAKNKDLENFARITAHDIKTPLGNISSIIELLIDEHQDNLDDDGKELIEMLSRSSHKLRELVDGILTYSKSRDVLSTSKEKIELCSFLTNVIGLINGSNDHCFNYPATVLYLVTNKVALQQIFINLITNGIKYNHEKQAVIEIKFEETDTHYEFSVKDNGIGMKQEHLSRIFNMYEVVGVKDRFGNQGTGIGLSTVKKLVEGLGGRIYAESEPMKGTNIRFSLKK